MEKFDEQIDWSFTGVWNKSLESDEAREYKPRDYLWASQLGKLESDVYLSLQGTEPTNPPNPRSLRKFEAGNIWEWIVKLVLLRAGILHSEQERVEFQYPGLLRVSGKIDFIAGGKIDYDSARSIIPTLMLPDRTAKAINDILSYLETNYPNGLSKKALEIKSCSSFVMNAMEITEKPIETHGLQAYHYTKHPDIDRTSLIYICRDDCRMYEFTILQDTQVWEEKYYNYIKQATDFYKAGKMPPKSPPIVFSEAEGKFSINRQIGWSPYLTLVYGYEDQMEFEEKYKKIPASWNRVLKRVKTRNLRQEWLDANSMTEADIKKEKGEGKKTATIQYVQDVEKVYLPEEITKGYEMTPKNLEAIAEMKTYGFDVELCAKKLVDTPEEDEEVDDSS